MHHSLSREQVLDDKSQLVSSWCLVPYVSWDLYFAS